MSDQNSLPLLPRDEGDKDPSISEDALNSLLSAGLKSYEAESAPSPPPPGIPADWEATEQEHLQRGAWRFFKINTHKRDLSIRENHWVLQGDQPRIEEKGLAAFLQDQRLPQNPQAIPPEVLAEQIGMFMIRGHSRRSCGFQVLTETGEYPALAGRLHPPESSVDASGTFHHRSWLKRSGGTQLQQFTVTLPPSGPIQVVDEWIYDAG